MDVETRDISSRACSRGELQVEVGEDNDVSGRRSVKMRSSLRETTAC